VSGLLIAAPMGAEALPGDRLLGAGFCGGLEDESVPGEVAVAEEVFTAALRIRLCIPSGPAAIGSSPGSVQ
jgi:hypothetical protein